MSEPAPTEVPVASTPSIVAEGDPENPAGPSKNELKKRAKEAEKAKKAAERAAREEEERKAKEAKASVDEASQNYGKLGLHQSQERNGMFNTAQVVKDVGSSWLMVETGQKWLKLSEIGKEDVGKQVIFRARMHNLRPQGAKIVFINFRQQTHTIQGVLVVSGEKDEHQVSKQMLKFAASIPVSSILVA
jgi:hypothetical protein